MYDLKIVGGTVVDGTGGERFSADVGVVGGVITEIGRCDGAAKRTIDAKGAIVAPGFVDLHTHYDGQISWDEELAPSSIHGVTTCAMGSCGVGFAPVHESDRDKLVELMEGVEDIPGTALSEGIRWNWQSFPEYMNALDQMPHTIDFLAHVPHDALRVYVMRERAVHDEKATPDDIERMRAIVREALLAGAAGFSTGRSDNHRSAIGEWTPSSEADATELEGIARAFVGLNHGVLQAVSDFNILHGDAHFEPEWNVLERMLRAGGGRPMSVSTMQRDHSPKQYQWIMERAQRCVDDGFDVRCQVASRGIGVMLGLQATFHPFMGYPSYKKIAHLSLDERVRITQSVSKRETTRRKSLNRLPATEANSHLSPISFFKTFVRSPMRLFQLSENPNYEPTMLESLGVQARQVNASVFK
ncbi:MAG: amidohydrolase family protein [Polyangiales bacterium]